MNHPNPVRKLTARPRAVYSLALILLAGWLATSTQAGVVFTNLYSFGAITNAGGYALDGANPYAGLVQGSDGYLYGTTAYGGTNGYYYSDNGGDILGYYSFGTVFKISTNGVLTTLYSFNGTNDGGAPEAGLVQNSDGNFYGTTAGSASSYYNGQGPGGVFKISTNGVLTTFNNYIGDQYLGNLVASLVKGSDGNFYGITPNNAFELNTNGVLTYLLPSGFNGNDGLNPVAALVQGSDGNFYGTTSMGGAGYSDSPQLNLAAGTVFQISTNGTLTTLHTFSDTNAADGLSPQGSLVQGSDGNFYGTTSGNSRPLRNPGTVFKITTNGVLTGLYSFTGGNDGSRPFAGLVQGNDGNLYGTTYAGGANGSGTVFKINPDGTGFTTLHNFAPASVDPNNANYATNNDGAFPRAGLILVGNTLYGTTSEGGIYGYGTVFSLTLPVPPPLSIIADGVNAVLTWPADATGYNDAGYILESATNLIPPIVWQTNSTTPIVIGGQDVIINPITSSQQFFRLLSP